MKPKAIFLTNKIYIDKSLNEGGVRLCTEDYIELLSFKFDLLIFSVENRKSIWYRILVKLGINQYNDFNNQPKVKELQNFILKNDITYLFLNQCNTAFFGIELKKYFGDKISVFICSHGNESGDLLHELTRFQNVLPLYRKVLANWTLGKTIRAEVNQRANGIDGVLTVSEVETQIENWLGAKKVFFVPRTIVSQPLPYNNRLGVVGFVGDLSHAPNFHGIKSVCEALNRIQNSKDLQIRIVGSATQESEVLRRDYQFVNCLGYLSNEELAIECESWSFFLNPVFYYSRGVSTKLAKALGMGLPVITTEIGNRGYQWEEGDLPTVNSPQQMASKILELAFDSDKIKHYRKQVIQIVNSTPNYNLLSNHLEQFVKN
jgi:glycosyltransferase involved in cell wall biosynthesis